MDRRPDGTTLWIAESTRYRIRAYTPATGATRVVTDALPGVPDGVTADGGVPVALYDRTDALDRLVLPTALGRELMGRLPTSLFVNEDDPLDGGVLVLDHGAACERGTRGSARLPPTWCRTTGGDSSARCSASRSGR